MSRRKYDFSEEDLKKVLLWCERHCCLCGKFSGVNIEVAHLEPNNSDIDNAMPVCFDCHAAIGHYNPSHPRGKKFGNMELKARREQIYELHTRHLVSPVKYWITQEGREFPDAGFNITNLGDIYPVKVRIKLTLSQGKVKINTSRKYGHYNGKYLWNLNPRNTVRAHFKVQKKVLQNQKEPVKAKLDVSVIDIYDREHYLLPTGYVLNFSKKEDWYFEPALEALNF